jgi:hypothetical protein
MLITKIACLKSNFLSTMKFSNPLVLTLIASVAQTITLVNAANCYVGPKWEYDSTTYSDSWNVRSSLCTQSSSESCRTIGMSTICEFQSGNVYGAFRADSQSEAMTVCWVGVPSPSILAGLRALSHHFLLSVLACL